MPTINHFFIIVMENKEAGQIVGSAEAPYINGLAAQYGRAAKYYGIRHPSLPNYLALTGGDTFGIITDCTTCFVKADNIANQLESAGRSWRAYMESMPQPCFVGNSGKYAQKHDPFIYYDNVRTDAARCHKIVPLTQLDADLQTNAIPDYVWISPDLCSDMHDCPIRTGDAWLQTWVPKIIASPAWQDKGVLIITFDEGNSLAGCCRYAAGGQVDTLVISPLARPGFVSPVAYDHYSLLRTIEAAWELPFLGKAGEPSSPAMADFFAAP
jgi:phosphatidylinositol-3-phosphatase